MLKFNKFGISSRVTLREPDTSLLDGPSVSRLAPATYLSAGSAAVAVASTSSAAAAAAAVAAAEQANENKSQLSDSPTNIPCTPNSTTSTAPLISLPHSPQPDSSVDSADEMPTQTTTKPVIITTTTTAEIILDENRFSLLGKDLSNDEDNLLELPNVPKDLHNGGGEEHKQNKSETLTLNSSSGTNASTAETSPLTTSPKSDDGIYATPTRKKHYRHHNNHQQEDVNSIESITENNTPTKVKVPNEDLSFLDDAQANPTNANANEKNPQRNGNVMINLNGSVKLTNDDDEPDQNTKRVKKKKNKLGKTKELDQLDGVVAIQKTATKTSNYNNNNNNSMEKKKKNEAAEKEEPEDEKFVQCLYYTLMCCDCTIS